MNVLYKIIKSITFCVFLACQAVPMHGFWPQAFCARLSAAIYQMPQRVKNSSFFKSFSWFSARPQVKGNNISRLGFYSIPAIPASLYHSEKEKNKEVDAAPNSAQCPKKNIKVHHSQAVALACSVLSELKIKINTSNPLKQIMGLSPDQQMRAFDYLQNLFADEDDESDLVTLYSVMQHLKAPRAKYPEFFAIIENNLGDCSRITLSKAVDTCKNIPPRFKEELEKANTSWVKAAYARSYIIATPAPQELHNILRKVPCSTSSWQAPERGVKNKVSAAVPMHGTRRDHEIAERLLQLYGSKNY